MIYKSSFALICVSFALVLHASESAPTTPVRPRDTFWNRGSDSESSSACSSTQPSPSSRGSSLFNSPAKRLPDSEYFMNCKRQKIVSLFANLLLGSDPLNFDVLKKEYDEFLQETLKEPFSTINAYNADLYNPDATSLLNTYVATAKQKKFSADHIAFPIFPFTHMISSNGFEGGYHIENPNCPVHKIVENVSTKIYGGTFVNSGRKKGEKFSSFFPVSSLDEGLIKDIKHAYQNPVMIGGNSFIGDTGKNMFLVFYGRPDNVELTSVFPAIVWADLRSNPHYTLELEINGNRTKFTSAQLVAYAKRPQASEASYRPEDGSIVKDIAKEVTGSESARGIYVVINSTDI